MQYRHVFVVVQLFFKNFIQAVILNTLIVSCVFVSKKRKKEETHVRNVKRKNDTSENSTACEMVDENTTKIIKKNFQEISVCYKS